MAEVGGVSLPFAAVAAAGVVEGSRKNDFNLKSEGGKVRVPDALAEALADHGRMALVGKVMGPRPDLVAIRKWITVRWKPSGMFNLAPLPKGFFLVSFREEGDVQAVIEGGPWFFGKRGLFLKRWTPDFDPFTQTMDIAPVWVRLPALPLQYWHEEVLGAVAGEIGELAAIDSATKRKTSLVAARFCVLTDLSGKLPTSIELESKFGARTQPIEYEWSNIKCNKCGQFGHRGATCVNKSKPKPNPTEEEERPNPGVNEEMVGNKFREGTREDESPGGQHPEKEAVETGKTEINNETREVGVNKEDRRSRKKDSELVSEEGDSEEEDWQQIATRSKKLKGRPPGSVKRQREAEKQIADGTQAVLTLNKGGGGTKTRK